VTSIFRVEGFSEAKATVQPPPPVFCQIPCHLRPVYCTEPPNHATDTSRRKRHHTGGHGRTNVKKRQ